jgi:hypothetical protein
MTIRVREAVVAEFLRKALADEAVGVPRLDAMARAAGLLGERQRITQAKSFRRAKDALGIRSVRQGFGAGGRWVGNCRPVLMHLRRFRRPQGGVQHQNPPSRASGSRELPGWSKIGHLLMFRVIAGPKSSKTAMRS